MARRLAWLLALLVPLTLTAQTRFPANPETGRAIGAKEMPPAILSQLEKALGRKLVIIDVRGAAEFKKDTIPGAINIPLDQLSRHLKDFTKDTTLVFT
ncbi:MAG: hypothetical protein KGN76_11025 [Acidobacteriota bacterium]|nr:hypothetical protein [Acidobacteriota bacterium]